MNHEAVQVPVALLQHKGLGPAAKVVWMVSELGGPGSPNSLAAASGLSRTTVYRALQELAGAAWAPHSPVVPIPSALLTDPKVSAQAKVLYGVLLLTPNFHHPVGSFSYEELAAMAHATPKTLARAVAELVRSEWITANRKNRLDRLHFELSFPGLERGLNEIAAAELRLTNADHFGEAVMREYLSLLVDSVESIDGGKPSLLRNPRTGQLLELDRFYPTHQVGFEFNGPQHYRATKKYSTKQVVRQQERDYLKIGLCVVHGISLVIVQPEDLTLNKMRQKVEGLLPLRDTSSHAMLIDHLETESLHYRRWAATL